MYDNQVKMKLDYEIKLLLLFYLYNSFSLSLSLLSLKYFKFKIFLMVNRSYIRARLDISTILNLRNPYVKPRVL